MLVIEGSSSVSGTVSKRSAGSAELSFMGLFVQNILYLFHAGSTAEGGLLLWEKEASQRREAFPPLEDSDSSSSLSLPLHTLCFPFPPAGVSFCRSGVGIAATQVSFGGSAPPVPGKPQEFSLQHFHKCQCSSAIVEHQQRQRMSAFLLRHRLCERLPSANVNEAANRLAQRRRQWRRRLKESR